VAEKFTVAALVSNVRDAAVAFGHRFTPPSNIAPELKKLLAELGINDPGHSVSTALASAAASWKSIADSLSGMTFDFTNPATIEQELNDRATKVTDALDKIKKAPETALDGLGASGAAIKAVFAPRLIDYIVYEFITKSHAKIGGVFLLLGVLRREFKSAGGNPAFVDAEIRVFDLPQLIKAITHPRETFLTIMRWGTNDFLARPVVDGITLLLGTVAGARGPDDDEWPLLDEKDFVTVDPGVKPSARRTLTVPGSTLSFVGLHRHGLGLHATNPVQFGGNLIPASLPASKVIAIVPGPVPATDSPEVKLLP
jgi:hypothetical protein